MPIPETHIPREATIVVAASDSKTPSADYVCDGTDDQVEIQAAIDALPTTGGLIQLLEGRFNISASVVINKPLTLRGTGAGGSYYGYTYLYLVENSDCDIITVNLGALHWFPTIEALGLDGNRDNNASGWGINQIKCFNLQIRNCMIAYCKSGGIKIAYGSSHSIQDNCIEFNSGPGLEVDTPNANTASIRFIGNHMGGNSADVRLIDWDPAPYNSIEAIGNEMQARENFWAFYCLGISNAIIHSNFIMREEGGGHVIYISNSDYVSVIGNVINMNTPIEDRQGIYVDDMAGISDYVDVIGNQIFNTPYHKVVIDNFPTNNPHGVVKDNADPGIQRNTDIFMDVLAVAVDHVRNNEDLSAGIPITFTIDAQPDVPRTLSWVLTHAQITEYEMEVIGIDAKGNPVTEIWDQTTGWAGETSNAFAVITSIKMTARTGTGAGDTMDIGITDVLGVSNRIYETGDVYKIKKNTSNENVAGAQVDVDYDTYDMAVIGLGAADDFTIWYRSNLNIIS